jgi:hypothetical protein
VFDDAYVNDYRLLEGFEERFWANFGEDLSSKGMKKKYAALHYAAHWINPSPGQLLEMVFRLRPGKPGVQNPFAPQDYVRILAEQDIAPYFRLRFDEIKYKIPALGYLRDMYRNFLINDEEMRSYHQDLGYTESDSERFVKVDKLERARMRASQGHGYTPAALASAYSVGVITPELVKKQMATLGFTEDEANDLMGRAEADLQRTIVVRARSRVIFAALSQVAAGLKVGVLDRQSAVASVVALGWPQTFAEGWVQMQSASGNVALVKAATARIRSAFLRGDISIDQASVQLDQLGIVSEQLPSLLATWQLSLTPKLKQRTASQIVTDLANGEISTANALLRLSNLGYDDADRRLFLADAQRKLVTREQMAARAQQQTERRAAAELQRQQKQAEQQALRLLAQLRRISPVGKMQKWAKLGKLGRDQFYERLRTYGYDDTDIER